MEGYMSDEEQVQRIKDWWKKHGTTVLVAIVIVLAANVGWRYWHKYKTQRANQASMIYEEMFSANFVHKEADFSMLAKHLIKDYGSTPYASMAALLLARQAISKNDLTAATKHLQWVISNSNSDSLRQIARIRKARILLQLKDYKVALASLVKVDSTAYAAQINETKGDIYLAMHNKAMALAAYKDAARSSEKNRVNPLLAMKIDQLKG